MAITTYTELQAAIADWLHRANMSSQIVDFISLVEARLQRVIKTGDQILTTTLSLGSTGIVAQPTGYFQTLRMRYYTGAVYLDIPQSDVLPSDYDGVTRMAPRVVSVVGSNFVFRPLPDQTYTLYLDYYSKFTPLSASNPSNWILANHPDVYLYGALTQSAPYVGTDTRLPLWVDAFNAAIDEVERNDFEKANSMNQARSDAIGLTRPNTFNVFSGR